MEWRKAAEAGARGGLAPALKDRRDREIELVRVRAEKAEAELTRTRAALDLRGKVSVCAVAQARSGLKMGVWSPADVVAPWSA